MDFHLYHVTNYHPSNCHIQKKFMYNIYGKDINNQHPFYNKIIIFYVKTYIIYIMYNFFKTIITNFKLF